MTAATYQRSYPVGSCKGWIGGGTARAAFMIPEASYIEFWDVAEHCANLPGARLDGTHSFVCACCLEPAEALAAINDEYSVGECCFEAGWYYRLTAPGYSDCTDWCGPFENGFRALRECCRVYEVDLDGRSWDEKEE